MSVTLSIEKEGKVFYGQELPTIESTTVCGVSYQLLAVILLK